MPLDRRTILRGAAGSAIAGTGPAAAQSAPARLPRVRPGDPDWPSPAAWESLRQAVRGNLIKVQPLFAPCQADPNGTACAAVLNGIKNPYFGIRADRTAIECRDNRAAFNRCKAKQVCATLGTSEQAISVGLKLARSACGPASDLVRPVHCRCPGARTAVSLAIPVSRRVCWTKVAPVTVRLV